MLRLRVPHLRSCKKRSIQHRGPQRPHHKRHNDVVTAVLQAGANQKRDDSHLRPSIARPQGLSMGAAGHYGPFTTLCIFQSLLNTPKNARWEVHHLSAAGSMPWFCPYRGIDAAIRTTLKKGGLLLGYNPRAPGSRLKARARTSSRPIAS